MSVKPMRSPASEFPNDNAALHFGAVWVVNEPCGGWQMEVESGEHDTDDLEYDDGADIEVVDELEPIDFELGATDDDPFAAFVSTLVEVATQAGCEKAAAILPALLDDGCVVPGILPSSVTQALLSTGLLVSSPAGLVGGEGFRRTASAWRAVLRGDSEDFSACGSRMLDEWAAELVAALVASPTKAEQLRRQLRTRGIAAFGLVLAA
jgi:hypothetical protein